MTQRMKTCLRICLRATVFFLAALSLVGCVTLSPAQTGKDIHSLRLQDGFVSMKPLTGGVLSTTYEQRFTDEAILRDWAAIDALRARVAASRSHASLAYAVARAEAEIDLAVDEYEENDRTGILDHLLNDARRLVMTQEPGHTGAADFSLPALPAVAKARTDLVELVEKAKHNPALLDCAGEAIAKLEVGLVALAHEQYEVDTGMTPCEDVEPYLLLVDHLADNLREKMASAVCRPAPSKTVQAATGGAGQQADSGEPAGITIDAEILFVFDKCGEADMLPDGRAQLDRFAAELVRKPDAWRRLVVNGHTDRLGRHKYNLRLSRCRAETVRKYLIAKFGLPAGGIEPRGMASTQPVVFCTGPVDDKLKACLQPNRRVEIEIK